MSLIPNGKRKNMVGQIYKEAQSSLGIDQSSLPERDNVQQQQLTNLDSIDASGNVELPDSNFSNTIVPNNQKTNEVKSSEETGIENIIIKALTSWGWPERKLLQYKENMVDEQITSDNNGGYIKNIKITAPNTYYGKNSVVSDKDFQRFISEIQNHSKIHFKGGNRKGKIMVINFSSESEEKMNDPAEVQLEKIYGKLPGQGSKNKAASTMGEIINSRKDELYETLRKIANGVK